MLLSRTYSLFKLTVVVLLAALTQACSLTVPIDAPTGSELAYTSQGTNESTKLTLADKLDANHQVSSSKLPINLQHNGQAIDAAPFVFKSLKSELKARQLPVEYADESENTFELQKFNIISHRVSGFSPMVTISTMKAELETAEGTETIATMVKRAKLPIWTMDEVNEPCYSQPFELMIKELAAKINSKLFGYSLDDDAVEKLVSKIELEANDNGLAYFDVYELGFSNNPKAIEPVKEFTKHNSEYVRLAAISSLGILGATEHFEYLKSIYSSANMWQDRGMALKAIGDLGTEDALAFLTQEKSKWAEQSSNEAVWNTVIIDLYLD